MKEFICDFEIKNKYYRIYNVDKIKGKKTYVGVTDYDTKEIFIENGDYYNMIKTLIHELMHVWLHENGHKHQDNGCFTYEQVCEVVAQGYEFINEIIKDYQFHYRIVETKRIYMED